MKNMKYTMKPLRLKPGNRVLFYIVYTPEGKWLTRINDRQEADALVNHLNREDV